MEILYKLRLEIDGLIQLSKEGRFSSWPLESYSRLKLAKAWTSKIIGILNPEENSSDVLDVRDLQERESLTNIEYHLINSRGVWANSDILVKIDFLLTEIDKIIEQLPYHNEWWLQITTSRDYSDTTGQKPILPDWSLERQQVYIHLTEAKMFLGFELLNLKDNV